MQLYELERNAPGTGAERLSAHLTTEAAGLMEFLREAELESPFDRIDAVKGIMAAYFG